MVVVVAGAARRRPWPRPWPWRGRPCRVLVDELGHAQDARHAVDGDLQRTTWLPSLIRRGFMCNYFMQHAVINAGMQTCW